MNHEGEDFEFIRDHPDMLNEVDDFVPELEPQLVTAPAPKVKAPALTATTSHQEKEALVRDVESFISSFVIFTQPRTALVLALWTIGTHSFESFDAFPYLTVMHPGFPVCGPYKKLQHPKPTAPIKVAAAPSTIPTQPQIRPDSARASEFGEA